MLKTAAFVVIGSAIATYCALTGQVPTGVEAVPYVVGGIALWGTVAALWA